MNIAALHRPIAGPDGPRASLGRLFVANLRLSLRSFGGAAPWALRVFVDEEKWLTPEAFAQAWGTVQILPGPNVVNLSIWLGARHRGLLGALVSFVAVLGIPTALACTMEALAVHWMHSAWLDHALAGVAAGAAGLVVAMGGRLASTLRGSPGGLAVASAALVALAVLRLPLVGIVAVLGPASLALAWRRS